MTGNYSTELPLEVYFLKYAFPCSFVTLQRGRIDRREFEDLERAAINGQIIERSRLEKIFVPAFKRIKKLAKEMRVDVWSYEAMREYFIKKHNEIIDAGEESYAKAPPLLRELCKVREARVLKVIKESGNNVAVVNFSDGKNRSVLTDLVGPVKAGEVVTVHYGYIVEVYRS